VNTGARRNATAPATITAPKMARRPSTPPISVPIASMVATAAKDVPCTIGSRAPIFHTPRVCSTVATPETSSPAEMR
jgi:hypothetical protein